MAKLRFSQWTSDEICSSKICFRNMRVVIGIGTLVQIALALIHCRIIVEVQLYEVLKDLEFGVDNDINVPRYLRVIDV